MMKQKIKVVLLAQALTVAFLATLGFAFKDSFLPAAAEQPAASGDEAEPATSN
jgi:hypothetical protein